MHLTQREAADRLDISLTALKNACRKLGIAKWPYTRLPGPRAYPDHQDQARVPAAAAAQAEPAEAEAEAERDGMRRYGTWRTGEMLEEVVEHCRLACKRRS
eukprot:752962-Hanusia_phi.AAC.1